MIIKCPSSSFLVSKALVPNTKKGCISFTDNRRNFQHLLPLGVLSSSPPMLLSDPPVSPVCRTYWGPLKPDIYTQSNIYKPKRTYSLIKEKKKKSIFYPSTGCHHQWRRKTFSSVPAVCNNKRFELHHTADSPSTAIYWSSNYILQIIMRNESSFLLLNCIPSLRNHLRRDIAKTRKFLAGGEKKKTNRIFPKITNASSKSLVWHLISTSSILKRPQSSHFVFQLPHKSEVFEDKYIRIRILDNVDAKWQKVTANTFHIPFSEMAFLNSFLFRLAWLHEKQAFNFSFQMSPV